MQMNDAESRTLALWQNEDLRLAAISAAPRPILQRNSFDCGVACVAMAAQVSYEVAHTAFCDHGLDAPSGKGRLLRPFSSNFAEIKSVLLALGREARMLRFGGWSRINRPSIMKVRSGKDRDRNWHWVYANRDSVHGLYVLDPARVDVFIEFLPPGMSGLPLEVHSPYGAFLELRDHMVSGALPKNSGLEESKWLT